MSAKCIGIAACGKCLEACPKGAITPGTHTRLAATETDIQHIRIDRSICDNCGDCADVCHWKALVICGSDYTPEQLLNRLLKDTPFYEHSGGGVTISGGEPLSQPEFILRLLRLLKEHNIHTALDTSGYAPYETIERILPHTDLFLYDLKHMDDTQHRLVTGVSNKLVLENAQRIARAGGKMQIRLPVIPDFNDSEESIRKTALFCRSLGKSVTDIQLLPYHNLGVMKYHRLDDSKVVLEAEPPSDEAIQFIKKVLEDLGLPVTVH
jgi:pyruvate formate lyase activating enzyme